MAHPIDMEYYFQDQLRWSFGFENPNKAAALIASLLPLLWVLAQAGWSFRGRFLRWGAVVLGSAVLWVGWWALFMTYSRGGIVAAIAGFLYIGWRNRTAYEWRRNRLRLVFATLGILVVAGLFAETNAVERSTQWIGQHEGSVENRFELWQGGLRMIAQIPQGVGRGNSGAAYMQWFQPLESTTQYRTLVNSYLTLAAEQGLCIFALALFVTVWLWRWSDIVPGESWMHGAVTGARGSAIAFAVAGFFSTTMEEWVLWIIPAICVIFLFLSAFRASIRPRWIACVRRAGFVTALSSGLLFGSGWILSSKQPLEICFARNDIQIAPIGSKPAWKYVVWVDEAVLGADYGKLLRSLAIERNAMICVSNRAEIEDEILIVSGKTVARLESTQPSKHLVLIAPARTNQKLAKFILSQAKSAVLLTPSFDEDGRVVFWNDVAANSGVKPQILDGVGSQVESAWDQIIKKL